MTGPYTVSDMQQKILNISTNTFNSTMDTIKILLHNVAHWKPNRHNLTNTYKEINPDIILLNRHELKGEPLKILRYTTHKINTDNDLHDGIAILVKNPMKQKVTNDFLTDILQITVETNTGPIYIATTYLPPRRPYLLIPDFHKLTSNVSPTYIIGDLT